MSKVINFQNFKSEQETKKQIAETVFEINQKYRTCPCNRFVKNFNIDLELRENFFEGLNEMILHHSADLLVGKKRN